MERNYRRNLQNEFVHNNLSKEQFFSEPVLFWETAFVVASKTSFQSFTWNISIISKNCKLVRIPLYAPSCGRCRSHSLAHIQKQSSRDVL